MNKRIVLAGWMELAREFLKSAELHDQSIKVGFRVQDYILYAVNEETGEREMVARANSDTLRFAPTGIAHEFIENLLIEVHEESQAQGLSFEEYSERIESQGNRYIKSLNLEAFAEDGGDREESD